MRFTQANADLLRLSGEFDIPLIGESTYHKKNSNIDYSINYTTFHRSYGVTQEELSLLDSVTPSSMDSSSISLQRLYFRNKQEIGFLINDELQHGLWVKKDRKYGQIIAQVDYIKGFRDGLSFVFGIDGIVFQITTFKNGLKHGEEKIYSINGLLKKINVFEHGTLVSTEKIQC